MLVDALLDRVLSRFEPEPASDDWAEDLRRFARAHRRLLVSHPWAVSPLFTQPNPGISVVRIGELALEILRRGDLSNADAVAAFSGIIALNYGWSSFTAARDLDPDGPSHDVGAMLARLPRSEFPLTVDAAGEMGAYGSDEHHELVLDRSSAGCGPPPVLPGGHDGHTLVRHAASDVPRIAAPAATPALGHRADRSETRPRVKRLEGCGGSQDRLVVADLPTRRPRPHPCEPATMSRSTTGTYRRRAQLASAVAYVHVRVSGGANARNDEPWLPAGRRPT